MGGNLGKTGTLGEWKGSGLILKVLYTQSLHKGQRALRVCMCIVAAIPYHVQKSWVRYSSLQATNKPDGGRGERPFVTSVG